MIVEVLKYGVTGILALIFITIALAILKAGYESLFKRKDNE